MFWLLIYEYALNVSIDLLICLEMVNDLLIRLENLNFMDLYIFLEIT